MAHRGIVEAHGFSRAKKSQRGGGFSRCGQFRRAHVLRHLAAPLRL